MTESKPRRSYEIRLLGAFDLRRDAFSVPVSASIERLLAFVALQDGQVSRAYAAGTLWADTSEEHAAANLRSALWRLGRCCTGLVDSDRTTIGLSVAAEVDARILRAGAHRLLAGDGAAVADDEFFRSSLRAGELLPGWSEGWVSAERERLCQLRLHTLEFLNVCTPIARGA